MRKHKLFKGQEGSYDNTLLVIYFVYSMIAAVFFTLNVPPFQNPDETNHLLRADNISRGYIVGHRFGDNDGGGIASPEIDLAGRPFDWPKFHPERKVKQSMYEESFRKFHDEGKDVTFKNTAIYPPFLYAPSVLAVWIGKAENVSIIQTLYLARFITCCLTISLIFFAIWHCLRGGLNGTALIIFTISTLPMSLSLQSSCSQDGPMIGVAAASAALFASLRNTLQMKNLVLFVLGISLLVMARPAYIFLALLPFALNIEWRLKLIAAFTIIGFGLAWTLTANYYAVTDMAGRNANIVQQIRFITNPIQDTRILVETLRSSSWEYLNQIVGQLGWLDVVLPRWFVQSALFIIIIAAAAGLRIRSWQDCIIVTALLFSTLGVFCLIYLSWNAVGAPIVEGVQGRYFTPLLIISAVLATTLIKPGGRLIWMVAAAFPVVSFAVTMRAVVIRYYLEP